MSLSSEHKQRQSNEQTSIFKQGVHDVRLCNKNAVSIFRLMPAFNPDDPNPETSWLPAVGPDGEPSDWGKYIIICTYIGYGQNKRSIVSPKTIDHNAPCPLHDLWDCICQDKATWGHMLNETKGMETVFKKPGSQMVINAIDINKINLGVCLGILNKSAADSLYELVTARIINPMTLKMVGQNYLLGLINGDLSDPTQGMQLACQAYESKKKNAPYSEYSVTVLTSTNPRTRQKTCSFFPVNGHQLNLRYDLNSPETYLHIRSYEEIVKDLVGLFNRRSPDGRHHDYDLLREAFQDCKDLVPPSPSAPGASCTVALGWQAPQSTPTLPLTPPQPPLQKQVTSVHGDSVSQMPVTGDPRNR